jgi:hypothetical protein
LWADFAGPQTVSWKTAVGVSFSGWMATFLSTAVAIRWQTDGLPLAQHLRLVESLALAFFLLMLLATIWPLRLSGKQATEEKRK